MDNIDNMELDVLNEECENILTGYSLYLSSTNIPHNHQQYLQNPNLIPTKFLEPSGLVNYLSKAINLFKKLLNTYNNEFLKDEMAVKDISGVSFTKACRRSKNNKDSNFGIESKIGLYRTARLGASSSHPPHWINLMNCNDICNNMLKETKNGDTQSRLTEKRLALVMTKHAVGRGGESRSLDFNTMFYNPHFDHLDATWVDTKTLKKYACPFVPNKDEYPTDVFHSMGCFFVLGRGLRRFQKEDGTISTRLMPYLNDEMRASNVSRFLTNAIRAYLSDAIPQQEKLSVSATSLRIAGVTEMGAANIGFYASHARSGHAIGTKQDNYYDFSDITTSLPAAKCLAGWKDVYGSVCLPTFSSTGAAQHTIDRLLDNLLVVNVPEFKPDGRLRPLLLACIASMIMYDSDVCAQLGPNNAITKTLKDAFNAANIVDVRASSVRPAATLRCWGNLIHDDFQKKNADFQPLTNDSNSVEVVNALNHMGTSVASLLKDNAKMRTDLARSASSEDELRSQMEQMRSDRRRERLEDRAIQLALMAKVEKLAQWMRVPPSPDRPSSSPSDSGNTSRKRPPPDDVSHNNVESSLPIQQQPSVVVAAPVAAMDTTMTTVSTAATAEATVPVAVTTEAPLFPTASVSNTTTSMTMNEMNSVPASATAKTTTASTQQQSSKRSKKANTLENNYNDTNADGTNTGTTIDDIIQVAYQKGAFKSAVKFKGIERPTQFDTHKEKYNHCLDLFEAVVTDEQRNELARDDLTLEQIINVSNSIGDACLVRLTELEGVAKPKAGRGYSGVGARVQTMKKRWGDKLVRTGRQSSILEFNNKKA